MRNKILYKISFITYTRERIKKSGKAATAGSSSNNNNLCYHIEVPLILTIILILC